MADVEKIAAELRAGLEAASKGAWQEGAGWVFIGPIDPERNPTHALRNLLRDVPDDELQANVRHIVAAQPENIRALLDELSRLREAERRAKEVIQPFAEYMDGGMGLDNNGLELPDEQGVGWVYLNHGHFRAASDFYRALSTQVEERE